ncbi:hypothetical protein DL93DRAFT_852426 [Clavulina sp. PMI_390]|nr:hypothetical protein DL93DRAFT_852426 [Clavulina sp. PMI_390]
MGRPRHKQASNKPAVHKNPPSRKEKLQLVVQPSVTPIPSGSITTYLPNELLFAIVDALTEMSSDGNKDLIILSTVNHVFSNIVNHTLWRSFHIGAHRRKDSVLDWDPTKVRKGVEDRCHAILRDPSRAALIVDLGIHLSTHVASEVTVIQQALAALPNLQTLRLLFINEVPIPASIIWDFTDMLGIGQFPFHIHTLFCEPGLFPGSSPNFFRFLHSQSSIQTLMIDHMRVMNDPAPPQPPPTSGFSDMLPQLHHLSTPTLYIRGALYARPQNPIQHVHIISRSHKHDLLCADRASQAQTEGSVGPAAAAAAAATDLAPVLSLLVTTKRSDPIFYLSNLPLLLPSAYGIRASSIRSLRIGASYAPSLLHWGAEVFESILSGKTHFLSILTCLETLELFGSCIEPTRGGPPIYTWGSAFRMPPSRPPLQTSTIIALLRHCETDCPTLSTISIKEYGQRAEIRSLLHHPYGANLTTAPPPRGEIPSPTADAELLLERLRLGRAEGADTAPIGAATGKSLNTPTTTSTSSVSSESLTLPK